MALQKRKFILTTNVNGVQIVLTTLMKVPNKRLNVRSEDKKGFLN